MSSLNEQILNVTQNVNLRPAVQDPGVAVMTAAQYKLSAEFLDRFAKDLDAFLYQEVGEPDVHSLGVAKETVVTAIMTLMEYWNPDAFKNMGRNFPNFFREVFLPSLMEAIQARRDAQNAPHHR